MRAQQAAALVSNVLALMLMCWWLVDIDGRGHARLWQAAAGVSRVLAQEFGYLALESERRYWEVVR